MAHHRDTYLEDLDALLGALLARPSGR